MAASPSARPRRLAVASDYVGAAAVSRQGKRLAFMVGRWKYSIWRVDLGGPGQTPSIPFPLMPSTRNEWTPVYSPDGRRIALTSDRSGRLEIWVCNSDGSDVVQLTSSEESARMPVWSPDGRSIAFAATVGGNEDVYVVSANGGARRRLTADPSEDRWPYWSRDGQSIYFFSKRSGKGEVWKVPVTGGEEVQVTRNTGDMPQESPDGQFLYFMKGGDRYPEECSVWKIPSVGGEETRVIDSFQCDGGWHVGAPGIYFFAKRDEKGGSELRLYEYATGDMRKILMQEGRLDGGVGVSPDGRTILYTQLDQAGSDLMLVENFR